MSVYVSTPPQTLPRRASCVYASFPFRLRFAEPIQFFSIYPGHLSAGGERGLARPSQVNARYTEQYFELQIGWAANMCSHLLCCCAPIDDVQESGGGKAGVRIRITLYTHVFNDLHIIMRAIW